MRIFLFAITVLTLSACGSGSSSTGGTPPPAGNTDSTPPTLSFDPNSISVEAGQTLNVSLSASDNVGITSGPNISCTNGAGFSNGVFTAPNTNTEISLTCTATASDAAGNTSEAILSATITPTSNPTPPPSSNNPIDFVAFETVPTRPMTKVGNRLFVVNPQDNHVEVYNINSNGALQVEASVAVGLEPISISKRRDNEVWVVNHLSDSISVLDISETPISIKRTLLVGDEPRDVVFAKDMAFVSTAHRGQHRVHTSIANVPGAGDPQTHDASIGRGDVWVFDADDLGDELGGKPKRIVELFGDSTRALAVSPDQEHVYAAVFHSGNQTTAVHEGVMCIGFMDDDTGSQPCDTMDGKMSPNGEPAGILPGGRPAPGTNKDGVAQPWTSMIVKYDNESGEWRDSLGRNFSNGVRFNLPDQDVFAINTTSLNVDTQFAHVGTTLFNLAVDPTNGDVFVTNTDAQNHIRFEGPGEHGGSTVRGNIARANITVLNNQAGSVSSRHLNSHIDYAAPDSTTQTHSIATPLQIEFSQDGSKVYVAALGSNKIAVYPKQDIKNGFDPTEVSANHITVDGGPAGFWLDEDAQNLYVYTHFDHGVAVVALETKSEIQRVKMPNPEPDVFEEGKVMLYDANRSSWNGEASCASCHTFGDMDQLAWNLGNPDESNKENPQPQPTRNLTELSCTLIGPDDPFCTFLDIVNGDGNLDGFVSMKGPMTTQTLRGTSTHGHMHWRGDRSNGYFGIDTEQTLDEKLSFKNFIVAFEGLLGLEIDLPENVNSGSKSSDVIKLEEDIDKFADFMLAVQLPPNPHIELDGTHSTSAQIGREFFTGDRRSDGLANDFSQNGPEPDGAMCSTCHTLDPENGFYGTDGNVSHGGEILMLKTPQLRNLYQKVGMFGLPDREQFLPSKTGDHQGDQIRGFGFLHDGATDQLFNFLGGAVFDDGETGCPAGVDSSHGCELAQGRVGIPGDDVRQSIVDYLMEFDTDLAPITGQQITISPNNQTDAMIARVALLERQASRPFASKILGGQVTACDVIATGNVNGEARGYYYEIETETYASDRVDEPRLSKQDMMGLATESLNSVTFTCVPPGSGIRMGLDRDRDGRFNRDEIDAGTDPAISD